MFRFFIAIITLLGVVSCENPKKTSKPTVLVSVAPYIYFVKKIASDRFEVATLVPAEASPHVYEPTPKEVELHRNALLWFKLGEPMEKKVEKVFQETRPEMDIVNLAQGISLLSYCEESHCGHHHDEGKDLHIWLSLRLAKIQAETIAAALISHAPEHKEEFTKHLAYFLEELDQLDNEIAQMIALSKNKAILVSHPAFGYFCKDYGLEQISIEIDGKEPLPQQITQILLTAKERGVHSILTEPQYSNKGAELIAEKLGIPVHSINPYAENYAENILNLAETVAQ